MKCFAILLLATVAAGQFDITNPGQFDTTNPGQFDIPNPSQRQQFSFGRKVYTIFFRRSPWFQASDECRRQGQGHTLVNIETLGEHNFIRGLMDRFQSSLPYIWIGGFRSGFGFQWRNGQQVGNFGWALNPFTSTRQPDNREGNEFCMAYNNVFFYGTGWHDLACRYSLPFICERNAF